MMGQRLLVEMVVLMEKQICVKLAAAGAVLPVAGQELCQLTSGYCPVSCPCYLPGKIHPRVNTSLCVLCASGYCSSIPMICKLMVSFSLIQSSQIVD